MHDNLFKKILLRTIYRDNSVHKILFGPLRGLRYKVNSFCGLSAVYGRNQRHTLEALAKLVKKDMVVYDIGGHCGLFTIFLARIVGKDGRVYVFEPVSYLVEQIRFNTKLNNFNNVTVVEKAVSDSVTSKNFDLSCNSCLGHLVDSSECNSKNYIKVNCVTLDYFVFSENYHPPQVMKIDVEGSEAEVLEGARQILEQYRPFIVCELHNPKQDVLVGKILIKYHYGAYRLETNEYVKNLEKGWPSSTGLWGNFVGFPNERSQVMQNLFKK